MPDGTTALIAEDPARARVERQLDLLERLAEVGLQVAIAVEAQARSGAPLAAEAAARAYARVSRAVRLTVMLQSKLTGELQSRERTWRYEQESAAPQDAEALQALQDQAKIGASLIIRRAIEAEHDDPGSIERLDAEACDRLDNEDLYGAVLSRPIGELVADICKDLGLDPDWERLATVCWVDEKSDGDETGEPFEASLKHPPPPAGEFVTSLPP